MTRAKDISKITTDANFGGTLDVTGTVTAGDLDLSVDTAGDGIQITSTGANYLNIGLDTNRTSSSQTLTQIEQKWDGTNVARLNFVTGTDTTNKDDGEIRLQTASAGTPLNRLRIESNGDISFYEDTGTTAKFFWDSSEERLGIGTTTPTNPITVVNSGNAYVDLVAGNTSYSAIRFADTDDNVTGGIYFNHANDSLSLFGHNNQQRLVIDSSGKVGIGTSSPNAPLNVNGTVELAGVLYRGIFGGTYQDSDIGAVTGGNPAAVQIQSASSNRPATLLLGGAQGTNEILGTIGFYNSGNTDTKRLRSFIYGGQSGGTTNEQGGVLVFGTASDAGTTPSERMRIESDGTLEFQGATDNVIKTNSDSSRIRIFGGSSASVGNGAALTLNGASYSGGNYVDLASATSGFITFRTGTTERARIDTGGNLLVSTTNTSPHTDGSGIAIRNTDGVLIGVDSTHAIIAARHGSDGEVIRIQNGASDVGSIDVSGSSTSYNTSSDHRLKESVTYDFDATTRLKQLKPCRFNFIADADTTVDGFLAHEVQSVVPEAITGTHNEVDADGNPVYQGIDQSKLVPLLVKTIQELEARIVALETA